MTDRTSPGRWLHVAVVAGLAVLAGALRLWSLPSRGEFDADQGAQLLVVRALVEDGVLPLLGPPTSIGDLHHGALFYYLLAPSAIVSSTDPPVVTLTIVGAGVGAALATWWLARRVAGPTAGAIAGGLMALSATAVAGSTFVWNPNLLPLGAALAVAGTFAAWADRRPAAWIVAAVGLTVAVQSHLLAHALVLPILAVLLLDARRRTTTGERAALGRALVAATGVVLVGYLPLIVNELTTGFSETQAFLAFVAGPGGDGSGGPGLVARSAVVGLRILSWPLTGLIVDAPVAGVLAAAGVLALLGWRLLRATADERAAMALIAAIIGVGWVVLAVLAPSLATVVPGQPVDHYHGFIDPLVMVVVGVGLAALGRVSMGARSWHVSGRELRPGAVLAGAIIVALVGWNLWTQPPAVDPDGGWPAVETAGARIAATAGDEPTTFSSLPAVKSADAYRFAAGQAGAFVVDPATGSGSATVLAIVCEGELLAAVEPDSPPCDGPAEDAEAARLLGAATTLADRFTAAPGRTISVYRLGGG